MSPRSARRSQRGRAATKKNRNISREDAKAQSKKRFPNLAFLAPWREEYPNPRVSRCETFARLAQILKYSSTEEDFEVKTLCVSAVNPVSPVCLRLCRS